MTERPTSLVLDLGTAAAASRRRHPWMWGVALAGVASSVAWAPVDAWLPCLIVALTAAFSVPVLPRRALTDGWTVACVTGLGAVLAWWAHNRSGHEPPLPFALVLGVGYATGVTWAAAVAHASRGHVSDAQAEEASARAAIWVVEHRWRVIAACGLLAGPIGVLWLDALETAWRDAGKSLRGLFVPEWFSPGAVLMMAAASGRRSVPAALEPAIVGCLGVAALTAAAFALTRRGQFGHDELTFVAVRGALEFVLVGAAVLAWAAAPPTAVSNRFVVATIAAVVVTHAGISVAAPESVWNNMPEGGAAWTAIVVRDGVVLLFAWTLAGSALGGAATVGVAIATCAAAAAVDAGGRGRLEHAAFTVPIAAIAGLNMALWILAVRRIRSFSVVPTTHRLRADWAVDLAPGGVSGVR